MSNGIKLVPGRAQEVVQPEVLPFPTAGHYMKNKELERTRREDAMKLISFPVEKIQLEAPINGRVIKLPTYGVFRMDSDEPTLLGEVGKGYKLIKHDEALDAALTALDTLGIPYEIGNVSLDRDGERMYVQIKFEKEYQISSGDVLRPILTLVNGIGGYNALGFDLESVRMVCLNLARAAAKDVSQKFMHAPSLETSVLAAIAKKSLTHFENDIIPLYRDMASQSITKEASIQAVAYAVKKEIVPVNVAQFTKHCVESDRALQEEGIRRTTWSLFNAFTWASTKRGEDTSSTRARDIRSAIGKAFADGGRSFLAEASKLDQKTVEEIFSKKAA